MSIGERLREERERLGISQTDFGELGRVGRKSQFNYESGDRFPDAQYLADIAGAGADVQYIVTGVRSDVALTPDEKDLLALFRGASLTAKAAAIGALQGALGAGGATAGKHVTVTARGGSQAAGRDIRGPGPAKEKKERK